MSNVNYAIYTELNTIDVRACTRTFSSAFIDTFQVVNRRTRY